MFSIKRIIFSEFAHNVVTAIAYLIGSELMLWADSDKARKKSGRTAADEDIRHEP